MLLRNYLGIEWLIYFSISPTGVTVMLVATRKVIVHNKVKQAT